MQSGTYVLKRFLTSSDPHPAGKVVIGTVDGDFHNIGKYLVNIILEGSGFDVIDLGVDVSHAAFISALTEQSVECPP
jgi:5-methyltetrahydrofolate--homocysteine methyltransferase